MMNGPRFSIQGNPSAPHPLRYRYPAVATKEDCQWLRQRTVRILPRLQREYNFCPTSDLTDKPQISCRKGEDFCQIDVAYQLGGDGTFIYEGFSRLMNTKDRSRSKNGTYMIPGWTKPLGHSMVPQGKSVNINDQAVPYSLGVYGLCVCL